MATRSRTSFQKRQKELARAEKQRDKIAKRAARKQALALGLVPPDEDLDGAITDEGGEAGEAGAEAAGPEGQGPGPERQVPGPERQVPGPEREGPGPAAEAPGPKE